MDVESIRTRPISTEVSGSALIGGGGKNRTMHKGGQQIKPLNSMLGGFMQLKTAAIPN